MQKFYTVDICGVKSDLPILPISDTLSIAFFNLHGAQALTEHCAKHVAKLIEGADVILTAESKGLQLAHCVARILDHDFYAVARKSKKLYMQDGISVTVQSITTKNVQTLYLSAHDTQLLKGKKVAIVDDVVLPAEACSVWKNWLRKGGEVYVKAFVLAEGDAANRKDIKYLASIPLF